MLGSPIFGNSHTGLKMLCIGEIAHHETHHETVEPHCAAPPRGFFKFPADDGFQEQLSVYLRSLLHSAPSSLPAFSGPWRRCRRSGANHANRQRASKGERMLPGTSSSIQWCLKRSPSLKTQRTLGFEVVVVGSTCVCRRVGWCDFLAGMC